MSSSLVAAGIAVLAAALLGVSSVAQRRGMDEPAPECRRGLLGTLLASVWWWTGTIASIGGLALQFLALSVGSLVVVQTTMVSSIAATTLAEWLLLGRRPGLPGWTGMTLTATGLVGVLWSLAPTTTGVGTPGDGVMSALGLVGAAGIAMAAVRARSALGGGLALAAATGLGYGITAVALKSVGAQFADGWTVPFTHSALWVAALLGPASVLVSQHALHRARRVAAAVSLIVVVDPLVGLFAGVTWFGEQIATTTGALVLAAAATAAVVAGIAVTHHGPRTATPEVAHAGGEDERRLASLTA